MSVTTPTKSKAKPQSKAKGTSKRVEANRRNAQKSTGPRTPEGKDRSRHNAVTHGMTARSPLLPGEDADELFARQRALRDDMQPRNELEARLLDRVGADMFRSDQSELAGDAQAAKRIRHEAREQAKTDEAEALKLGESLLWKPNLPLPYDLNYSSTLDEPPLADVDVHPRHPGRLLLQLVWTVAGCDWLLDRWAELNGRLNVLGPWRPADAFKMVRLTGKHAVALEDDYDVARALLCSLTLTGTPKPIPQNEPFDWVSALVLIMYSLNCEDSIKTAADLVRYHKCASFKLRLAELPLAKLAPAGEEQARQWLTGVIEGQIKRVSEIRAELAQIAAADAVEAPARLIYEIGPEGDKHRRYVVSNKRLVSKTVNDFFKARNMSESGVFNFVSGPLSVVNGDVETNDLETDLDRAKSSTLLRDEVTMRTPIRAEDLQKPNVECQRDEREARAAARQTRRRAKKHGTPAARQTLAPSLQEEASCDDAHFLRNEANADGDDRKNGTATAAVPVVEDHGIDFPTDEKKRTTDEAPPVRRVDEATDNGQKTMDKKAEVVSDAISDEQFRAMHFARWQRQKLWEIAQAARVNDTT
jgi:hypothetical protein